MLTSNSSLPVTSPKFFVISTAVDVINAWNWWYQNITPQPNPNLGALFIFDQKKWGASLTCLNHNDSSQITNIAKLYLVSQLTADPNEILLITQGNPADICISETGLDPQIIKTIESPVSFRNALSENLAFWAQLATIIKSGGFSSFVVTLPNTKPTDPGPDGLSLSFDRQNCACIEIRSVKNSINDPSGMIASANFRRGADPDPSEPPETQLDEFYLVIKNGYGFTKLERLLASAYNCLNQNSNQILRMGLIRNQSRFNAMIVADDHHARPARFESYSRIARPTTEKIATYIGAGAWQTFAENIRVKVISVLKSAGVY